jgi:hypothetical protein
MRMKTVLACLLLFVTRGTAGAETWHAELFLRDTSRSKCPDVPAVYTLAVSGTSFSLTTASGVQHPGNVSPDGSVTLSYTAPRVGTVVVSGNVGTKDLSLTARALSGCNYGLRPLAGDAARTFNAWKATFQQVSGNAQLCTAGYRGGVQTRGLALTAFGDIGSGGPLFAVKLKEDGSADVDTQTAFGNNSYARVKVAPGTGPRLVQFVTYTNVCGYKIVPD